MDLRLHYDKIRELERSLTDEFVIVATLAGIGENRPPNFTEVAKRLAAQLVVERRCRLATDEEAKEYRDQIRRAHEAAEQASSARMNLAVLTEAELRTIKSALKKG